ncbi:hypothetical protein N8083_00705 [Candidatus Pacebacteria bacterium]|nr:hypothetical protein [Candidatus Paceibacterota bacterium]
MPKTIINSGHIKQFKNQRRTIGLLQFKLRDDTNFSKWYALTENLVIKAFGQKSNQLDQLKDIYGDMPHLGDFSPERRLDIKVVKEKFKNLISVFISELELDLDDAEEQRGARKSGTNIKMTNTQTVIQSVDMSAVIKSTIHNIHQTEPDPEKAKEAEQKLKELESELKIETPKWAKVKGILEWLLSFSRDAFLAVLPVLLEKYK